MKGAITFVVIMSHQTMPTMEIVISPPEPGILELRVTLRPGANVLLELFPQACADCAALSPPKWYPEEVDKVSQSITPANTTPPLFCLLHIIKTFRGLVGSLSKICTDDLFIQQTTSFQLLRGNVPG